MSTPALQDALAEGLAATLRRYRIERNLTQAALATATGLSVRSVRNVELGTVQSPRTESLRRIARALALSDDELRRIFDLAHGHRMRSTRSGGAATVDSPLTTNVGAARCGGHLAIVMSDLTVAIDAGNDGRVAMLLALFDVVRGGECLNGANA